MLPLPLSLRAPFVVPTVANAAVMRYCTGTVQCSCTCSKCLKISHKPMHSRSRKITHKHKMRFLRWCINCALAKLFTNFVFLRASATSVNIGGLFPLTSNRGFGNQELAAIMLAFYQVNNKTDGIADNLLENFQARSEIMCTTLSKTLIVIPTCYT